MALHHFQHRIRLVRLGGVRIGPLHLGGGWYRVGPLSVLRVQQLLEAFGSRRPFEGRDVESIVGELSVIGVATVRPWLPLLVQDPVAPRHLRRVDLLQVSNLLDAVSATNDLTYVLEGFKAAAGEERPVGLDEIVVAVARSLGLGDPAAILRWPYQQLLAVLDVLERIDGANVRGHEIASEDKGLAMSLMGLGFEVQ